MQRDCATVSQHFGAVSCLTGPSIAQPDRNGIELGTSATGTFSSGRRGGKEGGAWVEQKKPGKSGTVRLVFVLPLFPIPPSFGLSLLSASTSLPCSETSFASSVQYLLFFSLERFLLGFPSASDASVASLPARTGQQDRLFSSSWLLLYVYTEYRLCSNKIWENENRNDTVA